LGKVLSDFCRSSKKIDPITTLCKEKNFKLGCEKDIRNLKGNSNFI